MENIFEYALRKDEYGTQTVFKVFNEFLLKNISVSHINLVSCYLNEKINSASPKVCELGLNALAALSSCIPHEAQINLINTLLDKVNSEDRGIRQAAIKALNVYIVHGTNDQKLQAAHKMREQINSENFGVCEAAIKTLITLEPVINETLGKEMASIAISYIAHNSPKVCAQAINCVQKFSNHLTPQQIQTIINHLLQHIYNNDPQIHLPTLQGLKLFADKLTTEQKAFLVTTVVTEMSNTHPINMIESSLDILLFFASYLTADHIKQLKAFMEINSNRHMDIASRKNKIVNALVAFFEKFYLWQQDQILVKSFFQSDKGLENGKQLNVTTQKYKGTQNSIGISPEEKNSLMNNGIPFWEAVIYRDQHTKNITVLYRLNFTFRAAGKNFKAEKQYKKLDIHEDHKKNIENYFSVLSKFLADNQKASDSQSKLL